LSSQDRSVSARGATRIAPRGHEARARANRR
jgi:hypothetical protein